MDDHNIFWLHERNSYYYFDCKKMNRECKNVIDHPISCACHLDSLVNPVTIGDPWCPLFLHTKSYVKIGEKCSICNEPITKKRNCWLTFCGHAFCRKCITSSLEKHYLSGNRGQFQCPSCKEVLPYDFSEYLDRYVVDENNSNEIDKLENFWDTIEFKLPVSCLNFKLPYHHIGMNKSCGKCDEYRKNGNFV